MLPLKINTTSLIVVFSDGDELFRKLCKPGETLESVRAEAKRDVPDFPETHETEIIATVKSADPWETLFDIQEHPDIIGDYEEVNGFILFTGTTIDEIKLSICVY